MRTSALFGAKNFECFEIYIVFAQTRGREVSQCGHFANKREEERVSFSRFCADVLYGRPLVANLLITRCNMQSNKPFIILAVLRRSVQRSQRHSAKVTATCVEDVEAVANRL